MIWLLDTNSLIKCHKLSKKGLFKENFTFTTILCLLEFPIVVRHEELTIIYPTIQTFSHALEYALKLRGKGTPIPTIDLLNATIAVEEKVRLVSDDSHFKSFQAIESSLEFIPTEDYIEAIQKMK